MVVAAVIAASVSVLTLIGTLAAQYFGRRATGRDTERALAQQGRQLDRTLAELQVPGTPEGGESDLVVVLVSN